MLSAHKNLNKKIFFFLKDKGRWETPAPAEEVGADMAVTLCKTTAACKTVWNFNLVT